MAPRARRSTLWADVVLNLALLAALTIALNGVLLWKVVQGREVALRADLAAELARTLALHAASMQAELGAPDPVRAADWQRALRVLEIPEAERCFAVIVSRGQQAVASAGFWVPWGAPGGDGGGADSLESWLLEATDLRAALAGRQIERGEATGRASLLFARSSAVASAPVLGESGELLGGVRVAVPIGSPLLGPLDARSATVLALSVVLGAATMGGFGFFLFHRRILAPLSALARGTRELAAGRFTARLPSGPQNELGELAHAFNEMAAALERYRLQSESQLAELRAANADLSQAREDLIFAEKMASVGRLSAGLAHEVGNPLASVIGFVELLQKDADGSLAPDLLPRIRAELDRIHRIIRDLLSYARPGGRTEGELDAVAPAEGVAVAEVVDAARSLVLAQRRFADVGFEILLPPGLPRVRARADRLQQVLLNLFVNAAEAMEGRGRIRVAVVDAVDGGGPPDGAGGTLTLAVEDEGPGIDARIGSNIYEPFFTTKEVGAGTGLGLAVSLRLVERM
jgi:signal transduction histidine kinase